MHFSFLDKLLGTDNKLRDTHTHTSPDNTVRSRNSQSAQTSRSKTVLNNLRATHGETSAFLWTTVERLRNLTRKSSQVKSLLFIKHL